ncbi:unnamed protein product [Rhizoctonia solani]|uniref:Uncharacterized protein n=1 Tax=Rhizoctonia solani TaxID=456999 RepID=A0A8H2X0C4_9AGAM|nr:unnamed protein product [Rhizoctonia solani]
MPTTRRRSDTKPVVRKGSLRNAAVLALSQVTKLVNLPLAQDVAHQTIALKPSVLQAPKENDMSAKELAGHVMGLLDVLDTVLPCLDNAGELNQLYGQLQDAHTELEDIQASRYKTKLASQTEIRDRILQLKEEITRAVSDLTLRLLVLTLASNMRERRRTRNLLIRTQRATTRSHQITMYTHQITMRTRQFVTRQQGAMARTEQRFAHSEQRIQELERMVEGLQRQGGGPEATHMWYTDGRGSYLVVTLNWTLFFFYVPSSGV